MDLPVRSFWTSPRWREHGALLVRFPGTSMTPHLEASLATGINLDERVGTNLFEAYFCFLLESPSIRISLAEPSGQFMLMCDSIPS
jgi:hypothetical protein